MGKLKVTGTDRNKIGNEKSEAQINKLFYNVSRGLMDIYVLFYLCIFPLSLHDKYFDILSFRFGLFWKPTLAYGAIFLFLGLLYLMCDALYNESALRKGFFSRVKDTLETSQREETGKIKKGFLNRTKRVCEEFRIKGTDIAVTVLVILFAISTALAEYPYEAFWGDRGRNQGLFVWLMFYIAYWLVTRFYKFKKWHIWAFMTAASMVCIWGMFNFFLYTFGMFENASDEYKYTFVSSIGNINTYTSFTGIFYGISVAMFIKSGNFVSRMAALAAVTVASFAQIMGMSDNAILSTGIVLAVSPLALCENYGDLARYFTASSIYLGGMKVTSIITESGIKTMNDPDPSTQIRIAGMGFFVYGLIIFLVIAVVFTSLAIKENRKTDYSTGVERFKLVWCVLIAIVAGSAVVVLVLANTGWHSEVWAAYKNLLIFDDSWGTGRGLCWRLGMEFWNNDATLLMKLFGYGPDTFYIITMDRFMQTMQDAGYGYFDSAHNEYFEYFITVGIFGLTAYLAFLYTSMRDMLSSVNMFSKAFAMGVLAYAFQAVVNIAIPITSVVFMMVLFVGISMNKKEMK
ncbi:O-Antigen ligase [Lachnospiraceae bacterium JC7]|nr:O-Antigen ligase [Lachnospiraceae bacterium JC7]